MRPIILTALLACQAGAALSQITLMNTATSELHSLLSLADGTKLISGFGPTITIYNMDLSVHRVLTLPPPPANYQWGSIRYVTEALFDQDSTTIEYEIVGSGDSPGDNTMAVARENGTVLFAATPGLVQELGDADAMNNGPSIVETEQGAVMLVSDGWGEPTKLYSLPGHVPCVGSCQTHATPPMMGIGETHALVPDHTVYPNPADQTATLDVALPPGTNEALLLIHDASGRLVFRTPIQHEGPYAFSTRLLPNGTYTCTVSGVGMKYAARLVVAR